MEDLTSKFDGLIKMAIEYTPKLILALIVLLIGLWVINKLVRIIGISLDQSGLGEDIIPFLKSAISIGLKVLLIFTVAGIVGIETTSFVAALAAVGFAVGMALQGSLGNLAAGILILIFKPYKVGDFISVGEDSGFVKEVQILNTIINKLDNKHVVIPNGMAISDVITNASGNESIRAEFHVYMPYEETFPKVKDIILNALKSTPKVLEDPAPFVGIETFDTHSIQLVVRPYCRIEDYEDVYYGATEKVKAAMGSNGIKVAYSEGVELGPIGS